MFWFLYEITGGLNNVYEDNRGVLQTYIDMPHLFSTMGNLDAFRTEPVLETELKTIGIVENKTSRRTDS
jgi:hypothetical protein